MFGFEAFEGLKIKEFTMVNDCFQDKSNEEYEHYELTLVYFRVLYLPYNYKCIGISAYNTVQKILGFQT